MTNEAIKTLEHYFRNASNTVHYLGSDTGVELFADFLQHGKTIACDAPDVVLVKDGNAIIVEHFEFDSSRVIKKGSTNRIEQARIEREQQKVLPTRDGVVYHSKNKAVCSYQDYINNVIRNFLDHYQRIETYKKNLISRKIVASDASIKTMFLIEDVSQIGNIVVNFVDGRPQKMPVILAQSPEFLDLVSQSRAVDYVLCCSYVCDSEYVWFIDQDEIEAYRVEQCDYVSMKFLSNFPSVVISKIQIPDKNQ
jgi:hypothetical protein